jgi:hypothetical protein
MNKYVVAEALALYAYNTRPTRWVEAIFPGRHPNYIAEKVAIASDGFWHFYGALDGNNRSKLVDAALEVYGHEAEVAVALRSSPVE